MIEKRFTYTDNGFIVDYESEQKVLNLYDVVELLNELNDEKEWLELNNKDLVSFIKSKGYILKDFLEYVGQFSSVGVNKRDWK